MLCLLWWSLAATAVSLLLVVLQFGEKIIHRAEEHCAVKRAMRPQQRYYI